MAKPMQDKEIKVTNNTKPELDATQLKTARRSQVVIKAQVIIFHKIFLSGCYECLHPQWSVINGVTFAVLMSPAA